MALPAGITASLLTLQINVEASQPVAQAPRATIRSLQLDAAAIVASLDTALAAAAGPFDSFVAGSDPDGIAAGVAAMLASAQSQANLAEARGLVGRVASNLEQI